MKAALATVGVLLLFFIIGCIGESDLEGEVKKTNVVVNSLVKDENGNTQILFINEKGDTTGMEYLTYGEIQELINN